MMDFNEWIKNEGLGAMLFGPKLPPMNSQQKSYYTAMIKAGESPQAALAALKLDPASLSMKPGVPPEELAHQAAFAKGGSGFMDRDRWNQLKKPTTTA